MINSFIDSVATNKEWVFSGIGVTLLVSACTAILFFVRRLKIRKINILINQNGEDLVALNCSNLTIEVDSVAYDIYDITSAPDLRRKKSYFRQLQRPLLAGERIGIISVDKGFMNEVERFVAKDKEAWSVVEPNYVFPIFLGLEIWLNYNLAGQAIRQQKNYKMTIGGYSGHGVSIGRSPYHFEHKAPLCLKIWRYFKKTFEFLRHPIRNFKYRHQMRLVQAKLSSDGVIRAYHLKIINAEEAEIRLKKIRKWLTKDQINDLDNYLSSDTRSS